MARMDKGGAASIGQLLGFAFRYLEISNEAKATEFWNPAIARASA
jgi:hypothetical protein